MPDALARRLGTVDTVVLGLGAMIGAGIFVARAPAAAVAGTGLLIGLAIAAVVACCNALSSAWLAARYPQSGGTISVGDTPGGGLTVEIDLPAVTSTVTEAAQ